MVPTKLLPLLLPLLRAYAPQLPAVTLPKLAATTCDGLLPLLVLMRWPGLLFLLLP
jgi:hypothetical protein